MLSSDLFSYVLCPTSTRKENIYFGVSRVRSSCWSNLWPENTTRRCLVTSPQQMVSDVNTDLQVWHLQVPTSARLLRQPHTSTTNQKGDAEPRGYPSERLLGVRLQVRPNIHDVDLVSSRLASNRPTLYAFLDSIFFSAMDKIWTISSQRRTYMHKKKLCLSLATSYCTHSYSTDLSLPSIFSRFVGVTLVLVATIAAHPRRLWWPLG